LEMTSNKSTFDFMVLNIVCSLIGFANPILAGSGSEVKRKID